MMMFYHTLFGFNNVHWSIRWDACCHGNTIHVSRSWMVTSSQTVWSTIRYSLKWSVQWGWYTPKGEDQPQLLPDLLDQVEWMAVAMKAQRDKTGNVLNVEVSVGGRYINSFLNGFVKFTRWWGHRKALIEWEIEMSRNSKASSIV